MTHPTPTPDSGLHHDPLLSRLRSAPLLWGALPLMAGIFCSGAEGRQWWLWAAGVGCLIGVVGMVLTLRRQRRRGPFFVAYMVVCFAIGALSVGFHNPLRHADHYTHLLPPQPTEDSRWATPQLFRAVLQEEPRLTPKRMKATVELLALQNDSLWLPTSGRALLYLKQQDSVLHLRQGDTLVGYGSFMEPQAVGTFDYGEHLRHRYIYRTLFCHAVAIEQRGTPSRCDQLRQRCLNILHRSTLSQRHQGIAEALLLGWKGDLDATTQQQYRDAGIVHLLCVSGLHVGLLALIVGGCLSFLGRLRWQRVVKGSAMLSVVWLYVLLTGGSPATLRAGVMFSFLIVGDMLFIRNNTFNTLAASAWVQLLWQPLLVYDIGFQLSYTAVLGIITLNPLLQALIALPSDDALEEMPLLRGAGWRLLRSLWSWVCISTAAKWATLPLTLYHFHQYPVYSLISNITVTPLAGVLLGSVLLLLLLHATGVGVAVSSFVGWQLDSIDALTRWVSGLPCAVVEMPYFSLTLSLMTTLLLLALTCWLWLVRRMRIESTTEPDELYN